MKRLLALLLLSSPALAKTHSSDFHPNPNFHAVRRLDAATPVMGNVEQENEIVILEGDDQLVSTSKDGYGIVFTLGVNNPEAITKRFYTKYADNFDELVIFTTFDDTGASGAAAYEISAQQDVKGLGQDIFDQSADWGSTTSRLHAFVNMMKWNQFDQTNVPLTDPRNSLYSVLGQEFAHRWLAFMHYRNQSGADSTAMLGRDAAHWASTMEAYGSFMDGNVLTLGTDGYYQTSNLMTTYSTLDLYAMGLMPASEVLPWFIINNAVTSTGRVVDPTVYLRTGAKISGAREDITIDQVIAAEGQRDPAWDKSPHGFRIAFVLLTRPGEHAADVVPIARTLDHVRQVWEQQFRVYTGGRASVCAQVSAPCGTSAAAHIDGGEIVEHGGNNNGIAEPGEPVLVTFHVINDSPVPARAVSVTAASNFVSAEPTTVIGELPASAHRDVVFAGTLPGDAVCGQPLTIDAVATVDGNSFRGFAELTPGLTSAYSESFAKSRDGWSANRDGTDTASLNGWEWGQPVLYRGNGWIYQPDGCHDADNCWFTGLRVGHRGKLDSSLEVGESRLYSTALDLSKSYQPVLNYWAWFQALDYSNAMMVQDAVGVSLLVEGSTDGGQSWTMIDTVDSIQPVWQLRQVPLDGIVDTSGQLLLRFTAENPTATTAVEAGIDDLSIDTLTAACNPDQPGPVMATPSAGGCSLGGRAPASGLLALLLLGLVALLRRRLA